MSSGSKLALLAIVVAAAALLLSRYSPLGTAQRAADMKDRPATRASTPAAQPMEQTLRVCADPNNLPFSNRDGGGFENELAELVGRALNKTVTYTWWPQRRGFIRNTVRAGLCDVVMGVPHEFGMLRTTRPYYRSSYVFVTQQARQLSIESFDDPRLATLRIGVHAIGDDYSNVPPVQVLALRGHVDNIHGYSIYGDYSKADPPRELIDAVARDEVDVAIAWGPLAGYFATRQNIPLELRVAQPDPLAASFPMSFSISMGVRRDDDALHAALEHVLDTQAGEIRALLERYAVPLHPAPVQPAAARRSAYRAQEQP
jgi:quinoprotein dehydrogenase-associated probable ABC transporter substrate-binding protein